MIHNQRTPKTHLVFDSMYPKVKVRVDEVQDDQHHWRSMLSLKDVQFLSLQDSCFPVKEHQDVCPSPVAKIPESYVPSIVIPSPPAVSASEGVENKSNSDEEDRPNIRASSVPRPRAVLSSPNNDAVIGNENKIKTVRPSALKNHNSIQRRHAQCKVVTRRHDSDENPPHTTESKDAISNKSGIKERKGSASSATSSRRRNIMTAKPSSVRI